MWTRGLISLFPVCLQRQRVLPTRKERGQRATSTDTEGIPVVCILLLGTVASTANVMHVAGATNIVHVPGAANGMHLKGATNVVHVPGATSVVHVPGVANGMHLKGATNVMHVKGATNAVLVHSSGPTPLALTMSFSTQSGDPYQTVMTK